MLAALAFTLWLMGRGHMSSCTESLHEEGCLVHLAGFLCDSGKAFTHTHIHTHLSLIHI